MKVMSWNLLRLVGASVEDVAALIARHRPDLFLMQEATEELAGLTRLAGGNFFREPMDSRVYGLAAWSPHPFSPARAVPLPVSVMPGRVPPRIAQILRFQNVTIANVHLSHGQILNRRQLQHVARTLDGAAVIIGDYNALGPIKLAGFGDVGPRGRTHSTNPIVGLRLDRCMVRGVRCSGVQVLDRGPSDHHPMLLNLDAAPEAVQLHPRAALHGADALRDSVQFWLRAMARLPDEIRVNRARRGARLRSAESRPGDEM